MLSLRMALVSVSVSVLGPGSSVAAAPAAAPGFAAGIVRPPLPPMGWRSWNWFACDVDQSIMEQQAAAMAATPPWATKSLRQLGYTHIGLDDCWQSCIGPDGSFHDRTGTPIVNTTRFPSLSGMVAKAKSHGLTSGFYGNNCRCHQGEIKVGTTHYAQDAALTIRSGFAGTKIDSCGNMRDMTQYAQQFADVNRSLLVESCGNGPAGTNPKKDLPPLPSYLDMLRTTCPWSFYRVSVDLGPTFLSTVYNVNRALPFLAMNAPLSRPGCWAYMDMMMVGVTTPRKQGGPPFDPNPMNPLEWQTHFAMWAVTSSPLILGFDLTNATRLKMTWPIISNEEVLAVSQTWQGHPGRLVANSTETKDLGVAHGSPGVTHTNESLPSWQAWAKPVQGGAVAVLVVRVWEGAANATVSFPLADLFSLAGAAAPASVSVRDVHTHTDNGTVVSALTVNLANLPARGCTFVVLTPV